MSRKNNMFKQVPVAPVARNLFDLSHEVKMTGKFGFLYPCLLLDTVPGDTIRDQVTVFLRMAPMLAPIYHRVDVTFHAFFVPMRLLIEQDRWENFITGGGAQGDINVVLPYVTPAGIAAAGGGTGADSMRKGSIWDYLGLPIAPAAPPSGWSEERISVFPFRACAKVWNDYYRDPNIEGTELDLDETGVGDLSEQTYSAGLFNLYRRGWEKDYFTSCLPWAQRGTEVLLPLSGTGNVTYMNQSMVYNSDNQQPVGGDNMLKTSNGMLPTGGLRYASGISNVGNPARIENIDEVTIENSSVSINDVRMALALQAWMEANARGGGRYIENIQSQFNVRTPDYRLQRAEYLGGGKQAVQISEVLATANTEVTAEIPVGEMFGHGVSAGKSNRFTYRCSEHGFIVGFLSVLPVPAYDLGIERMWSRQFWYDFAWPKLANLGEQEVKSKELYFSFAQADTEENDEVFGYIPRYAEYKFKQDRFVGDFRDTLMFWHLGRSFTSRPQLDNDFLEMNENLPSHEVSSRRIFSVQDGTDYLWVQMFHRMTAKRPLPYFGIPQLVG